jgi:hypothetical protein
MTVENHNCSIFAADYLSPSMVPGGAVPLDKLIYSPYLAYL